MSVFAVGPPLVTFVAFNAHSDIDLSLSNINCC